MIAGLGHDPQRAAAQTFCLFLDFDGTLVDIAPTTDSVRVEPHSKATAVEAFMQARPFLGRSPIYIGDDETDIDGFEAARRFNGHAIAVGNRVGADHRLANPTAVREWLETLLREPPR